MLSALKFVFPKGSSPQASNLADNPAQTADVSADEKASMLLHFTSRVPEFSNHDFLSKIHSSI